MRKHKNRDRLNVRTFMEELIEFVECMGEGNYPIKANIPPAVWSGLVEFKIGAKAILRKHDAKRTRKDIYVPAP